MATSCVIAKRLLSIKWVLRMQPLSELLQHTDGDSQQPDAEDNVADALTMDIGAEESKSARRPWFREGTVKKKPSGEWSGREGWCEVRLTGIVLRFCRFFRRFLNVNFFDREL